MTKTLIIALILLQIPIQEVMGQTLDIHNWQDRVLIINTDSKSNQLYQKQIELFYSEKRNMYERKLVLYEYVNDKYRFTRYGADSSLNEWNDFEGLQSLVKKENSFELILLGLDGQIKLRQTEILDPDDLFTLIDSMPIRKSEIKHSKDN